MAKCSICKKDLPVWFSGDICSGRCRTRKTRLKQQSGKNLYKAVAMLDDVSRAVELGLVDLDDAIMYCNKLIEKSSALADLVRSKLSEPE